MADVLFSSIANGSTIAFDPATDVLVFDEPSITAASLTVSHAPDFTAVGFFAGATGFTLPAAVSLMQLTTGNVAFADGSRLVVGDDSTNANDLAANSLVAGVGNDRLLGLWGDDALAGGDGDDVLDGGAGNDTLDGGIGADSLVGGTGDDTYIVDTLADTIVELGSQVPQLVSLGSAGQAANGRSQPGAVSDDGRYALFESTASNLVAGGTNGQSDVFLRDLATGSVRRVTTDAGGAQANGFSGNASLSADGRYVAFESRASNLVAGDDAGLGDIFVKDLQTGAVQRVSTDSAGAQANGASSKASFSADGRYVVFGSDASNLVPDDTNDVADIFVKNLQTGAIARASTDGGGGEANYASDSASISADGRYVAFRSYASQLIPGDTGDADIFVKDLETGAIQQANIGFAFPYDYFYYASSTQRPSISADGRHVSFYSYYEIETGTGDEDGPDVEVELFVKDLQTGDMVSANETAAGVPAGLVDDRFPASLSADGHYIVFGSGGKLVPGDVNHARDVFVKDLWSGAVRLVSAAASGAAGNGDSVNVRISADGTQVLFGSDASNLVAGDGNANGDVFLTLNPFAAGGDTVRSSVGYTLQAELENLVLTGNAAIDATGNSLANALTGNGAANVLDGANGADTLTGGSGNDTYFVGNAGDRVVEQIGGGDDLVNSTISYTLAANVERLTLIDAAAVDGTGNALKNTLVGNAAANVLDGGASGDRMAGGDGSDTYVVDSAGDLVSESNADPATGGVDSVDSSISYTLGANVENLKLVGAGPLHGTGNTLDNVLYSGAGNNLLDGGGGNDTVSYRYAVSAVSVSLASLGAAQVTGGSGSDTLLSIESLTGSDFNDTLTGNAGDNTLDGGLRADRMTGGDGSDTYVVNNAGDVVIEGSAAGSGGVDTVVSYIGYTLGANLENLRIMAAGAVNGTGNGLDNILYSGTGKNSLDGAGGSDTASYLYAKAAVTVSLASTAAQATGGSGSDTLLSIENLTGSAFDDTLSGNAGDNTIDGRAGADVMAGGDGSDTYVVTNVGDVVSEVNADPYTGGIDTVNSTVDYTLGSNVENLRITSSAAVSGTGNSLDNILCSGAGSNVLDGAGGNDIVSYRYAGSAVAVVLTTNAAQATGGSGSDSLVSIEGLTGSAFDDTLGGNGGNNSLDGGVGADRMTGGNGSDTYTVDNTGDVVTETNASAITGGRDTVLSSIAYTLGANVENLRLTAAGALDATGNGLNNILYAGAGDNVLDGGGGSDSASYRYADAAVTVSLASGAAQATGGSGSDTLVSIESLTGSGFDDHLTGNGFHNVIGGGRGNDFLTGAGGSDTFFFSADLEPTTNVDVITDFASGDDRITLGQDKFSAAGAVGVLADSAFALGTEAADDSDRIVYDAATGNLYYDADGNGAGAQILFATLVPGTVIVPGDLWLG